MTGHKRFATTLIALAALGLLGGVSQSPVLADSPQSAQSRQQSSPYTSSGSGYGAGQYSGYGGGGLNPQLPSQSNPYMAAGQDQQWARQQYDIQQRYGQQQGGGAGGQLYNPYNPYSSGGTPQQQAYRGVAQNSGSGAYSSVPNSPYQQPYPQAAGSGPFGGFNAPPNPLDPRYAQQDMRYPGGVGQQRGLYYNSAVAVGSTLPSLLLSAMLTLAAALSLGQLTR